jgi:hypothetical protein
MSHYQNMIRAAAKSLPEIEESTCHGTPALYVRGKLLARLQEDGETMSVGCAKEDRDVHIEQHPDVFSVTDHFRDYDYILMNLSNTSPKLLRVMLENAWRRRATKKAIKQFDATST